MFFSYSSSWKRQKLLNAVCSGGGALDDRLSDIQLSKISRLIVRWEAKAYALGLTEVEVEDIKQDYQHNEMRRVAMLRKWATKFGDRATLNTLIEVSFENNWIDFIGSVCSSLGYIPEAAGYRVNLPIKKTCLVAGLLVIVIVVIIFGPSIRPKVSKTLPNTKQDFLGRDRDMEILLNVVDFSNGSFRFINIIGPPGFGKSALAINVGHKMLARTTEVRYINLMDFPDKNFKQILAERILIDDNYIEKEVTFDNLIKWGKNRWWSSCLIILDNCDDSIENQKEEFYDAVNKLLMHSGSHLKFMTTSREALFHSDAHYVHKVNPIDTESACQILEIKNPALLTKDEKQAIAHLTGEVPLALKIVGALLSYRINSATEIIDNLKEQPIDTLSPQELQSSMRVDASISLSYNYLDQNIKKIGRYLSHFPGSFDLHTALGTLSPLSLLFNISKESYSIKKLVQLSLLEFDEKLNRYHYHKLIKDYFNKHSTVQELGDYIFGLKSFYSVELCEMAKVFRKSPREALRKLDLDRHHIQLLMSFISQTIYIENVIFDHDLAACFVEALITKYLNCRFTLLELINVVNSFVSSFEKKVQIEIFSNKNIFSKISFIKVLAPDFKVYVNLAIKLSDLLQNYGEKKLGILYTKLSSVFVDMFCNLCKKDACDIQDECRVFYSHILLYEDHFDAETAKLYHIHFLERSGESLMKCKSADTAECNYGLIGNSYHNLKEYKKARVFFEKALYDERFQYPVCDRIFMLLWLRNRFRDSIDLEQIENDLEKVHDQLLNLTAAELYGIPSHLILDYQEYLVETGEYDKAYLIQEHWIQAMKELEVESTQQEIKFSRSAALKLYRKGHYKRSLDIVNYALTVINADAQHDDYINFYQIKGSVLVWMNNFTESNKAYKIAIEHLIYYNMTSDIRFEQLCWDLFYYLHNFEYIPICYSNKFLNLVHVVGEGFLYVLFKVPLNHISVKSPKSPKKMDIPLEYFPSLFQQSRRTDLVSNEAGEVFEFKPDFTAFSLSALENTLAIVKEVFNIFFELNCLRLCFNILSIFLRLVILYDLLRILCHFICDCFRIFHHVFYFILLIFVYIRTKWLF